MDNYVLSSKGLLLLLLLPLSACVSGNRHSESLVEESTEIEAIGLDKFRNDFSIEAGKRVGMVTRYSTERQILKLYGAHAVRKTIGITEGNELPGLVLFPDTQNEAEVVWDPIVSVNKPAFVRISKDKTDWTTTHGVTIGTSLKELEKINGKPFYLNGFEWDLGGLVTSWEEGNLTPQLIIALIPTNYSKLTGKMMGEIQLRSDNPDLEALGLQVGSIVISFQ